MRLIETNRLRGLSGEDTDPEGYIPYQQVARAPIPAYNGPVNTAVWGSAGDPLLIHEQKIYAAGFYHVVGDPVTWYSDLIRFNGESGEMETIRQRATFDAESDPVVARFLNDPDLWDIYISGREFKRIGTGDGFVFDVIAPMKAAAVFNPAYGLIVPGNVYRAIIEQYSPKQHIGGGWFGGFMNQNIQPIVTVALVAMGGYAIAAEGFAAEVGAELAAEDLAIEALPEIVEYSAPELFADVVVEDFAIEPFVEEIALDPFAEQLALEAAPELTAEAAPEMVEALTPEYYPPIEAPAPSPLPGTDIPGASNWWQLATKAVSAGTSLYQRQQAKKSADEQAAARARLTAGGGAPLSSAAFPLILLTIPLLFLFFTSADKGKRHVSRSNR
jgi:hypothetical protein